ncbi:hypothetical protein J3Q64DRAFT_1615659, partial [Phycomyces blakesleeanus]
LQPLYDRLLSLSFTESVKAIEHCRDLCAQFGFTVKQEASTHRNIYVYCSREGVPDSLRKRGATPQRKRPSKRCDCRWRVVLYEKEGRWEFRKSQNPDAAKHNHELMRPDEIERNWPKAVIDMICELARQRLTTQEIRTAVKDQFTTISWNERRFYNRLSEERQKIKHREAATRARNLTELWTKVCMAAAGNEELSRFVETEATKILATICQTIQLEPDTLRPPTEIAEETTNRQGSGTNTTKPPEAPKGYTSVIVPRHTYFVKLHSLRTIGELNIARNSIVAREGSTADESGSETVSPARRVLKRTRDGTLVDQTPGPADALHALQQQQQQQHTFLAGTHPHRAHPMPPAPVPQTMHQGPSSSSQAPFVYHPTYDSHGMPIGAPLPNYVHSTFYHHTMPPQAPNNGYTPNSDLNFHFNTSHGPMMRQHPQAGNS